MRDEVLNGTDGITTLQAKACHSPSDAFRTFDFRKSRMAFYESFHAYGKRAHRHGSSFSSLLRHLMGVFYATPSNMPHGTPSNFVDLFSDFYGIPNSRSFCIA